MEQGGKLESTFSEMGHIFLYLRSSIALLRAEVKMPQSYRASHRNNLSNAPQCRL